MAIKRYKIHRWAAPVSVHVATTLAAADPFYRGPPLDVGPHYAEPIHPLDPTKTARDLGRLEPVDTAAATRRDDTLDAEHGHVPR